MKSKKGFTLVEMLIVVAIIAILVGISIPVVNAQQEKAKEAVDLANVRVAYTKVMMAAMSHNTDSAKLTEEGVKYIDAFHRWYIDVELQQQQYDWQTAGPFNVGGVTSDDSCWVGKPTAGGHCIVSYSEAERIILAWEYDFTQIMTSKVGTGTYKGKSMIDLFTKDNFPMLESSGGAGRELSSAVKNLLGMKNSETFAYKIVPVKDEPDRYEIYVSTERNLDLNLTSKKNTIDYRSITVTGYKYEIKDGVSTLIQTGTPQDIKTYVNAKGEEKIDVYGDQYTGIIRREGYRWE